jgi:hypothetical protein
MVAGVGDSLKLWRVAAHILNNQQQTVDKGRFSILWFGCGANTTNTMRSKIVMKCSNKPHTWTDYLGIRLKLRNMDMRFSTWNIRSLYGAGSIMTVSKELSEYKLDLAGIQEVRWDRGGMEPAGRRH